MSYWLFENTTTVLHIGILGTYYLLIYSHIAYKFSVYFFFATRMLKQHFSESGHEAIVYILCGQCDKRFKGATSGGFQYHR